MNISKETQPAFTIKPQTIVIDCKDSAGLISFYSKLLGWEKAVTDDGWEILHDPLCGIDLAFEPEEFYERPVWPEKSGLPQKMLHLDFLVSDLQMASEHALACGAQLSPDQFYDDVRVFFDPAGHPFCLFTGYR